MTTLSTAATLADAAALASRVTGVPTPGTVDPHYVVDAASLRNAVGELLSDALLAGARELVTNALDTPVTQVNDGIHAEALGRTERGLRSEVHDLWAERAVVDEPRLRALVALYALHTEVAEAARQTGDAA